MWFDTLLVFTVIAGLFLLGTSRLGALVELFAAQALALSLLPLFLYPGKAGVHGVLIFTGMLVLKVLLMPAILFWAMRHVTVRREVKPLIGFGPSILLALLLIGGSFLFSKSMVLPGKPVSPLLVPCAFSTVMIGLLLLTSRSKAIAQVTGYLVFENGIYLFGLLLVEEMPFVLEMGILLDVFVGVFVMGIVINHIQEAFDHVDTAHLAQLKD